MDWDRSYYTDDANRGVDWTAAVGADDARCAKKAITKRSQESEQNVGRRWPTRGTNIDQTAPRAPWFPPPRPLPAVETPWLCGADLSKGDAMGNRNYTGNLQHG